MQSYELSEINWTYERGVGYMEAEKPKPEAPKKPKQQFELSPRLTHRPFQNSEELRKLQSELAKQR